MMRQTVTALTLATTLVVPLSIPWSAAAQSVMAQTTPPTQSAGSVNAGYLLGVGDQIQVEVFNAPEYSGQYQVLAGGIVNLPFIGNVAVSGLTVQQASETIAAEMAVFIRRPRVTLSLLDARPMQVAIAGEINRPGSYRVAITNEELPTLTQVIELAGGITQFADLRNIEVQRLVSKRSESSATQAPLGITTTGGSADASPTKRIDVNLWQLLKESRLEEDLLLQDGDRIVIPTATALTPEEVTELASASFSPDEMLVNVVGEVDDPGAITLPPNTPLNQAILAAGGFNNRARTRRVVLVRLNPNGTVTRETIPVDLSDGINSASNPALRPNDTVVVSRSTLSRVGDTVGDIIAPLGGIFGIIRTLDNLLD